MPVPTLSEARLRARLDYPALGDAITAMTPVERVISVDGVATLASDQYWRLYWSVEALTRIHHDGGTGAVADAIAHEAWHCLRRHGVRRAAIAALPRAWNIVCDARINAGLPRLPAWAIRAETIGAPPELSLEEELYRWYISSQEPPSPNKSGESGESGSPDKPSPNKGGDSDSGESGSPNKSGRKRGGKSGKPDKSGDSGGKRDDKSGAPTAAGACAGGSSVTGRPAEWEDPAPDTPGAAPGLSDHEARAVAERVARAIASAAPGTVPGDWRAWATATIDAAEAARQAPTWRRALAAAVRGAAARATGDAPSARIRAAATMTRGVIVPRCVRTTPRVTIVADTSASMACDGGTVAATVEAICRAVGAVRVVYADAATHGGAVAHGGADVLRAARGGGGTDLRAAIRDAARHADVVVAVTDCDTPWDSVPPRGARVIVARTRRSHVAPPAWARIVDVGGAQ